MPIAHCNYCGCDKLQCECAERVPLLASPPLVLRRPAAQKSALYWVRCPECLTYSPASRGGTCPRCDIK